MVDKSKQVRVAVVGTSWWSDAMYLPALKAHPQADVIAVCGRDEARTQAFARQWDIPQDFTDYDEMLAQGLDAVIIASSNASHYPYTIKALKRSVSVLCEKPLAMNLSEAKEMAELAKAQGVTHMVPFTYRFMPTARYTKELIEKGYIGTPYHLNMRYYTGFARSGEYLWRFNVDEAGSGVVGDIGAHWFYLARWFFGEVKAVTCQLGHHVARAEHPDGRSYERADDSAMILLEFSSGAQGNIHVTAVCYEDTPFGQTHHMEFHGSDGTLYSFTDWDKVQELRGAKVGEGAVKKLELPEHIWGRVRRDTVHNTYKDVFRKEDYMTRGFISAVAKGEHVKPDFFDGLRIQEITDAAVRSAKEGCRIELSPFEETL